MLDESWRREGRVMFSTEQIKKWREIQVKIKVKFTLKQSMRPGWGVTVELYPFLNLGPR